MPSPFQKLRSLYEKLAVPASELLQAPLLLFFRLYWFLPLIANGWGKLMNHGNVTQYFESLGIPAPGLNAWFIGLLECLGGIALSLGVGSRLVACLMVGNFTVALLAEPKDRAKAFAFLSDQDAFLQAAPTLYLIAALVVLAFGPGKLSVDALLASRSRRAGSAPAEGRATPPAATVRLAVSDTA